MFDFFTRLFGKVKEPAKEQIIVCSKHGKMPYFCIACSGIKYPLCGHCLGEFLTANCGEIQVIEKEIKE